jgi:predicted esterase
MSFIDSAPLRLVSLSVLVPLLTQCAAKDTSSPDVTTDPSATTSTTGPVAPAPTTIAPPGPTGSPTGPVTPTGPSSTGPLPSPTTPTTSAPTSSSSTAPTTTDVPATDETSGASNDVSSGPESTADVTSDVTSDEGPQAGAPVPSAGCGKARTLNDGNHQINSGGQNRTYHVKAPANYDQNKPYRLIFMFHWNYGSINAIVNPPDADQNTDDPYYGLGDVAGDSTIFVVPQGLKDGGGEGWANTNNRDVNFTDDMLAAVTDGLCVDTSRVFTTGFSWGGAISYKLACDRPDKFRAALVYGTGPVSGNRPQDCKQPIAFFQTHGLDDGIFNYQMTGLSVLDIFVGTNSCTKPMIPTPARDEHVCIDMVGCAEGYPVRHCAFGAGQNNPKQGGPGGHYPSPKDPGQSKSWVPTEAWEFIQQF